LAEKWLKGGIVGKELAEREQIVGLKSAENWLNEGR
jgi:hypothetical protein